MEEKSVLILMASYNGEKYIEEQIQSILNQTYNNFTLWIQDDASSDSTLDIIKQYMSLDCRIRLTVNDGIHGPYYNFHSLINKAKDLDAYDYYMFCDHDDVWHPRKIEKMVNAADSYDSNMPVLIYANMQLIDGNGNVTEEDVDKKLALKCKGQWDLFYNHRVYGCNSLFNQALFNIVPKVDLLANKDIVSILCHDNYYAKFAALFGKLVYLDEITMSYRRYGKNVTAAHRYDYGIKRILNRVADIDSLEKDHARTYSQSLYTINVMLKQYGNNLQVDKYKALCEIQTSLQKGGTKACKCFLKYRISCGIKVRTFSRFAILMFGAYKKYLIFTKNEQNI